MGKSEKAKRVSAGLSRKHGLVVLLLLSMQAQAQSTKLLTPFVDVTYSRDNNLFRKPDDDANPTGEQLGDSSVRAVAGLSLEKEFGLQKLSARASLAKSKYAHFDFLDYDSRDAQLNFAWRLGSHLSGNVRSVRTNTLTPYIEFRENKRNLRVERSNVVDAAWRFHPSWRVRGSVDQLELTHDLLSQKYRDRTQTSSELWLDYLPATGSAFGLMLRHNTQRFPFAEVIGSQNIINNQRGDEVKLKVDWKFSGKTQLQLLLGVANQKHEVVTARDFRGVSARLTGNWYPTGKLEVAGSIWREIDATNNLSTNFAVSNGIRIAPAWNISPKLRLDGLFRYEKRVPVGVAGVELTQVDKFATASLTLTYVPLTHLQLITSLTRETLNSNLPIRSFHSTGLSFNAHYEY